ncbi:hypothetical protein KFK09_013083 [Dendrobium nobile]|uniref:Uncharacterized protein n=1 Tax=Dendrobium nobile TaxID=94219 RepID=A0A8T3BJ71_DENNO|nr:hypothetical protein KFK09_013083 [Dendrobium nobile]
MVRKGGVGTRIPAMVMSTRALDSGSQATMVAKKGKDTGPQNMVMILMMWKRSIAIISIIFATTRVSNSDGEWLNVPAAHYINLNKAGARNPCCVRLCLILLDKFS